MAGKTALLTKAQSKLVILWFTRLYFSFINLFTFRATQTKAFFIRLQLTNQKCSRPASFFCSGLSDLQGSSPVVETVLSFGDIFTLTVL